jgi:hypothetical protein
MVTVLSAGLLASAKWARSLRVFLRCRQRRISRCGSRSQVNRPAVGQAFTPELHEALATVIPESEAAGTVFEKVESSYKLGDRLLRPARVVGFYLVSMVVEAVFYGIQRLL